MEFKLIVESSTSAETHLFHINSHLELQNVVDDVSLYNSLSRSMLTVASIWHEKWDDLIPLKFMVDANEIEIFRHPGIGWLWEVAQLVTFLEGGTTPPEGAFLAVLSSVGWKWSQFDDFESWCDGYVGVVGDMGDYAREHFESRTPEEIMDHVDWDGVGDDLATNFTVYEWDGESYYFSE